MANAIEVLNVEKLQELFMLLMKSSTDFSEQQKHQSEFRIKELIDKKGDKLYVKW